MFLKSFVVLSLINTLLTGHELTRVFMSGQKCINQQ